MKFYNFFGSFISRGLGLFSLVYFLSIPASAQDFVSQIHSPEFEKICNQSLAGDCENIAKSAYLATDLIYRLFEADNFTKEKEKPEILAKIANLYNTTPNNLDIVNKRFRMSDFFQVPDNKTFGGYAVIIRREETQNLGKKKISFVISFKGVYSNLEDPNDIIAAVSAIPDNLYSKAGTVIHRGFRDYAGSVFFDVKSQKILQEILQLQKDSSTDVEILVTGHSLGGCAILYAAMLVDAGVLPANIQVIVFGSAPVAQKNFVNEYPELVSKIIRVETQGDLLVYDDNQVFQPIYKSLQYTPFGHLIQAQAPKKLLELSKRYVEIEQERKNNPSDQLNWEYLQLIQQIVAERVDIHIHSYAYYYQYYLNQLQK